MKKALIFVCMTLSLELNSKPSNRFIDQPEVRKIIDYLNSHIESMNNENSILIEVAGEINSLAALPKNIELLDTQKLSNLPDKSVREALLSKEEEIDQYHQELETFQQLIKNYCPNENS